MFRFITQTIIYLIQIDQFLFNKIQFYLNKLDNGLSNRQKYLINRILSSILVVVFLIRLFHKSNFCAPKFSQNAFKMGVFFLICKSLSVAEKFVLLPQIST